MASSKVIKTIRGLSTKGISLHIIGLYYLMVATLCPSAWAASSGQSVIREDSGSLSLALNLPLYTWQLPAVAPKAVVVTIHGVTLHGAVFDKVACALAKDSYMVVSPDLRGFGRWCLGSDRFAPDGQVSFYKSRADLIRLLAKLKNEHSNLPVYLIGESIGANLALWLASICPQYVDGVILSSPCVKRKLDLCPPMVVDTLKVVADREKQVPTRPYARRYLSEDQRIIKTYLEDPLMRKTMTIYELFQSLHAARSTLWFVDQIPDDMPVLVIEGTNDRMFYPKEIDSLLSKLKVNDKSIHWLEGKGHIQLETPYASEELIKTISSWLTEHLSRGKGDNQQPPFLTTSNSMSSRQEDN